MSKSSKPKDKDLKKPRPKRRTDTQGSGSPALDSGFQDKDTDALCIISFRETLALAKADQLDRNTELTLVQDPSTAGKIIVFQNGQIFGEYNGENLKKMLGCMKLGYTYQGRIIDIKPAGVTADIQGAGA